MALALVKNSVMPSDEGSLPSWYNSILKGDCISALEALPRHSIDMIFADPPYNLQLNGTLSRPDHSLVDAVDNDWDQFENFCSYDAFTSAWLLACRRVLKPNGTIWIIGSYHNIFRVGSLLQDLGFWLLNDVIWRKVNPMPNFRGRRFQNAHETLLWAVRSQEHKQYTFNYQALKAANEEVQMRSDWFLPICSGAERLRDEEGKKIHPTQKPEALIARLILAASKPGDVILDPFFGSGTTGAVAKKLGRHFVGIEREADYIKAARQRLHNTEILEPSMLNPLPDKKAEPRIAFLSVVENGLVRPGTLLFDSKKRCQAVVRPDGTLSYEDNIGSIHAMGRKARGSESCNGWTFWHFEEEGNLHPLDQLRERIKKAFL